MKKLIIDRFEGEYAICEQEDKSIVNILNVALPEGVTEGDCIIINELGIIKLDNVETEKRKTKIVKLIGDLFE